MSDKFPVFTMTQRGWTANELPPGPGMVFDQPGSSVFLYDDDEHTVRLTHEQIRTIVRSYVDTCGGRCLDLQTRENHARVRRLEAEAEWEELQIKHAKSQLGL